MEDQQPQALTEPIKAAKEADEVAPIEDEIKNAAEAVTASAAPPAPLPPERDPINGEAAGPMSKNQIKKLKKREAYEERKKQKKEKAKLERKQAQEIKKVRVKDTLNAMNEEELTAWRAQRAEKVAARNKGKIEKKERMTKAIESGQRIVIDLEFPHLMTEGEQRSMAHQVSYSYGTNTRTSVPAHLILSGVQGTMQEHLAHSFPGFENWMVTSTSETYLEHFAESKSDLIYLTADSPTELQVLDPGKIYIVGGIVDRNRHKNLCYNKAIEQGIATARLPIGDNIKLASSMVMCTNHVVDIMLKWMEVKDWEAAFKAVIPTRKRKASVDDGGEEEEEEEEGEEGFGKDQKVNGEEGEVDNDGRKTGKAVEAN
ncbi:hypothetical protein Ndes2526B_g05489 [Nannochloris sp. 'desiccata']|nr:putative tRNA (guanine(9)-N1)-methyltransferase [Chlorella desiccata (nom. nud.)]